MEFKKENKFHKVMTRIVIGIMIAFLVSIIVVAIAIKLGAKELFTMDHDIETEVYELSEEDNFINDVFKKYNNALYGGKNYIDAYANDLLFGRTFMVESAARYKKFIGWKLYAPSEYNSILYLDDGHLASANPKEKKEDIQKIATKINSLKDVANEAGSDFTYIQTVGNIDKFGDKKINNVKDFANYNADMLLSDLKKYNIKCFDLRDTAHEEIDNFHELFYITDHHWKTQSALWGTKKIANYLNANYGVGIDESIFDENNFSSEIKKDYYLGSLGKKATLALTNADDFTILRPKTETNFTFTNSNGLNKTGSFDVLLNEDQIDNPKIYKRECYLGLLSFEASGLSSIVNNNIDNDKYILMIGDSMMIPVAGYLALDCKKVELIDPRYFDGSIKEYVKKVKADIVIATYSTTIIQDFYPCFDFD